MRSLPLRLLAISLAAGLYACSSMPAVQAPWLKAYVAPPQRAYYSAYRRSSYGQRARATHVRRARHETVSAVAADKPATPVSAAAEHSPPGAAYPQTIALTLAGDNADRERAIASLDLTGAELARAHSQPLSAAQEQNYLRASELASRARQALADNDCAAASSLARKARSLAAIVNEK
jgi:hypothetical protein